MKLVLSGADLTAADIKRFVSTPGITVELSPGSLAKVEQSFKFLNQEMGKRVLYGINTGFGPMASHVINNSKLDHLQKNS